MYSILTTPIELILCFQMLPMLCCLSGRLLIRVTSSRVQMSIWSVTSKPIRPLNVSNGFTMCVHNTLYFMSFYLYRIPCARPYRNMHINLWAHICDVPTLVRLCHIFCVLRPNINYYLQKTYTFYVCKHIT